MAGKPDNTFSWEPMSVWYDTVILFQFMLLLPLVLMDAGVEEPSASSVSARRQAILRFLFYVGIPAAAVVLQHWYKVLMPLYPTVAISLLLIYMNIQRDQEQALLEKELELSDGHMYYLDLRTGVMQSGWTEIDGKLYYFATPQDVEKQNWYWDATLQLWIYDEKSDRTYGSMYHGEQTPDGYVVDAAGVWEN